ncbi:MAG: hypothetical protein DME26_16770 [Verrucomicrobia bacterium]|nr:MAG: hypothetical protein DME26_16770 [Verrucomicrobiota bacterium]
MLNAIVKVADQPVKFSVEEFGVVFSPDTQSSRRSHSPQPIVAEPEQLRIRTFRVDSQGFLQGLEGTFGISSPSTESFDRLANSLRKIELQLKDAEEMERRVVRNGDKDFMDRARATVIGCEDQIARRKQEMLQESAKQSAAVQETLRKLFAKPGVNMDAPKAVFYNPVTGIVMVNVTARDLEVVQAALETLGGTPLSPQQAGAPGGPSAFNPSRFGRGIGGGGPNGSDKVPVLGDLPLIGRLFRSDTLPNESEEKRQYP